MERRGEDRGHGLQADAGIVTVESISKGETANARGVGQKGSKDRIKGKKKEEPKEKRLQRKKSGDQGERQYGVCANLVTQTVMRKKQGQDFNTSRATAR